MVLGWIVENPNTSNRAIAYESNVYESEKCLQDCERYNIEYLPFQIEMYQ